MKKLLILALLLAGCKGKDGADGRSFTSSMVSRNGIVSSDNFVVNVPGLSIPRGDILQVYTCLNTGCVQLDIFQPGTGLNVFYAVMGANVTIFNALSAGNNLWYISALEKV